MPEGIIHEGGEKEEYSQIVKKLLIHKNSIKFYAHKVYAESRRERQCNPAFRHA